MDPFSRCSRARPAPLLRAAVVLQAAVALIGALMVFPVLSDAASVVDVYRMIQYDLGGAPFGSRKASFSLYASSGLTTSAASEADLMRAVIVMPIQRINFTLLDEVVAGSRKVGGLLFILPRHFSSSLPDSGQGEDDDAEDEASRAGAVGEGAGEVKEHVEVVARLEERLLEANIPVPVYFAVDNAELSKLAADVESNDRAGKPASATNGGFKLVVAAGEPRKLPASSPLPALEAWLYGGASSHAQAQGGRREALPIVAVVAPLDTFGLVPSLATGPASSASGVAAVLQVLRLLSRLFALLPSARPPFHLLFLLSSGGPFNFDGTRQWLASLDQSVQDRLEFAICVRAIGAAPGGGEGGSGLHLHVSRPLKDPTIRALFHGLSSAAAAVDPPTSVAVVHKKVNISDAHVPWQHELFSRRKLVAASLSSLPSAPRFLRHWGGLADTRASVDERQLLATTRLIAETIASHIFNSSSADNVSSNLSEGAEAAPPPIAFFPPNSSLAPSLPYLSHWLSLLSHSPRVAPLLAKDDPIIAAIQAELALHADKVEVRKAALDPHYTLYSTPHAQMHIYQVASITFDLVTFLAVAMYLSTLFVILHTATKGFDDLVALFKGKPAHRKAKPSARCHRLGFSPRFPPSTARNRHSNLCPRKCTISAAMDPDRLRDKPGNISSARATSAKVNQFSIWAMPEEGSAFHASASAAISNLSTRFGCTPFEPHVTVIGAFGEREGLDEQEVVKRMERLSASLKPYDIQVMELAAGQLFFQCVYLKMLPSKEVLHVHNEAVEVMGMDRNSVAAYMPHLSLIYGDLSDAQKQEAKAASTMSVVGFDVGNERGVVGIARQRGIDIALNEESNRETPNVVCFGETQRYLGVAGAASYTMNPKNTVSQIKRMIGRKFADPEFQKDLPMFPFRCSEGPDGDILVHVMYMNEPRTFTPTQLLAMVLNGLKAIGEKDLGSKITDCVIGIPVYLTDAQRRAYLDAATIAGLHPLRLMHEPTATALAYGIYKTDLSETEPLNIAFVDIGHSTMQVSIVAFKKGQLKVLAHAFDRSLGGRDFDEVLFNHFVDECAKNHKLDIRSNARACLRLRTACEKLKKVLSANPESPLHVECLMDEKDVTGFLKRDQFEQMAKPILERVKAPCARALLESGITVDQIAAVELVGSGSRVPAIMKILAEFFGKEPRRTMNASECVARGCALQCAMLSPAFKVREFEVHDTYPFAIALSWKQASAAASAEGAEGGGEEAAAQPNQVVFSKNNPLPSSKLLTFYRTEAFTIDAFYANPEDQTVGANTRIGTFTVGPFAPSRPDSKPKLKVKIRLNLHGILSVESATLLEEEEVEVPAKKDAKEPAPDAAGAPMDADAAAAGGAEGDAKMDDAAQPAKPEMVKKKKTKKTDVPIEAHLVGGLPPAKLQQLVEEEFAMALQDRVMEETKEKKNAVESYVYDMRNKLHDKLAPYATEAEKEQLLAKLQETEDWLYEDGESESKGVYISKLDELKRLGDPIEARLKEEEARPAALQSLQYCIGSFREAALSTDAMYAHIDPKEKAQVVEECNKAEMWLRDMLFQQQKLSKKDNPVLLAADLRKKAETLDRFCKPIMTKPKPAPKPAAEPKPEPAAEAPKAGGEPMETEGAAAEGAAGAGGEKPAEGEAMQTDHQGLGEASNGTMELPAMSFSMDFRSLGRDLALASQSAVGSSKDFLDLVKAIGEAKSKAEEDRIMAGELELLKKKISEPDVPKKRMKEYILRLMYLEILGHDASFGYIHAVKMTHDDNLLLKRTGYLACTLFLDDSHDLIILIVNTIQKDLKSDNYLVVCAALGAVCKLINEETIPAVLNPIVDLLKHPKELVRKKAVMALQRFHQRSPSSVSHVTEKFRQALCDKDPSVMSASLCGLHDLIAADPAPYRNLTPSFLSILKQVAEGRLPKSFDYHRVPAPFIQIKLLKLLALLGANNQAASEPMYPVIADVIRRISESQPKAGTTGRRDDSQVTAGNAILYEAIRTVAAIHPSEQLLASCAAITSSFLKSSVHNLRYMGVDCLAQIVRINPELATEHQIAVIDCLEDPDDSLKRKTLDLLYKMTGPGNVEVIVEHVLQYLRGLRSGDDAHAHGRADLAARIVELAERFAPSNEWFIQTMNSVFEVAGDVVRPKVAHDLMRLIAEGSGGDNDDADSRLRSSAVQSYVKLLKEPNLPTLLLQVICWVLGEYATSDGHMSADEVMAKLCDVAEGHDTDDTVRAYVLSAMAKVVAYEAACGRQARLSGEARALVEVMVAAHSTDVQHRAYQLQALLALRPDTLAAVLPVDASCEDIEIDPALPFLDQYVADSLAAGARPYLSESDRLNFSVGADATSLASSLHDSSASAAARHADRSLRFEAYEQPKLPSAPLTASQRGGAGGGAFSSSAAAYPSANPPPALSATSSGGFRESSGGAYGGGEASSGGGGGATDGARLNLSGVQRKWGRPAAPPPSAAPPSAAPAGPSADSFSIRTDSAASAAGAGGAGAGAAAGRGGDRRAGESSQVSEEKQRLAAKLFGGKGAASGGAGGSSSLAGTGSEPRTVGAAGQWGKRGSGAAEGAAADAAPSSAPAPPPAAPVADLLLMDLNDDPPPVNTASMLDSSTAAPAMSATTAGTASLDPFKALEELTVMPAGEPLLAEISTSSSSSASMSATATVSPAPALSGAIGGAGKSANGAAIGGAVGIGGRTAVGAAAGAGATAKGRDAAARRVGVVTPDKDLTVKASFSGSRSSQRWQKGGAQSDNEHSKHFLRQCAPNPRDVPPRRAAPPAGGWREDTGIASEKDWGIDLKSQPVNECGINEDGSTWYRESGEDMGDNGYRCRWTIMGGRHPNGASEWKETWWEKSDWTGYKELGAEKSGRNDQGDSWWETWQEVYVVDNWSGIPRIERSAHKQAKSRQENVWNEKWWEKYNGKGWTEKGSHKYGRSNDQSWWEKWGEQYDGQGMVLKWTDKWAEKDDGTKWGDKWEERFTSGVGHRQGETWHVENSGSRWSRTWGEEHFGDGTQIPCSPSCLVHPGRSELMCVPLPQCVLLAAGWCTSTGGARVVNSGMWWWQSQHTTRGSHTMGGMKLWPTPHNCYPLRSGTAQNPVHSGITDDRKA
ncbi:unnamed protein product [Closterium sp. Yama58-4]|nr:unnamed protein product [Closterium sp. Yama58-4]